MVNQVALVSIGLEHDINGVEYEVGVVLSYWDGVYVLHRCLQGAMFYMSDWYSADKTAVFYLAAECLHSVKGPALSVCDTSE